MLSDECTGLKTGLFQGREELAIILFFTAEAVEGAATAAAVAFLGLFLGLAPTADHIPQHSAPQGQDHEQDYVRSQIHSFQLIVMS